MRSFVVIINKITLSFIIKLYLQWERKYDIIIIWKDKESGNKLEELK